MSPPIDPHAIAHEAACFARARFGALLEKEPNIMLSHVRLVVPTGVGLAEVLEAMRLVAEPRLGYESERVVGWCQLRTSAPIRPGHRLDYLQFTLSQPDNPYPYLNYFANRIVATVTMNKREQSGVFLPKGGPVDWVIQYEYGGRLFNQADPF